MTDARLEVVDCGMVRQEGMARKSVPRAMCWMDGAGGIKIYQGAGRSGSRL